MSGGCAKIETLRKLARGWGGDLREMSAPQMDAMLDADGFWPCPFDSRLGVLWREKVVLYSNRPQWPNILHEMGHIFASVLPPPACTEWDFFGWEYAIAHDLRGVRAWNASNADYSVDGSTDFGALTRREKDDLIVDRILAAENAGLIVDGKPVAIR